MFLSVFFWQTRIDVRSETHDHQAGDFDDLKRSAVQGNGNPFDFVQVLTDQLASWND